ncbi:hypothetical protein [Suttonella ornithocola]|uniref:Uncharacterized protein n=1 Tax=Suttonella ornithocola TaxID=279832 RepID=A0A380MPV2_9GAMM|nr:hypothetical protein [Suttonella ornithocola]SUO93923.1 Uncharacterised protein [Suttonella ornithocola]
MRKFKDNIDWDRLDEYRHVTEKYRNIPDKLLGYKKVPHRYRYVPLERLKYMPAIDVLVHDLFMPLGMYILLCIPLVTFIPPSFAEQYLNFDNTYIRWISFNLAPDRIAVHTFICAYFTIPLGICITITLVIDFLEKDKHGKRFRLFWLRELRRKEKDWRKSVYLSYLCIPFVSFYLFRENSEEYFTLPHRYGGGHYEHSLAINIMSNEVTIIILISFFGFQFLRFFRSE